MEQNNSNKKTKSQISFCPQCGGKLPEGAKVCPYCGAKVANQFSGYYDQREQKFAGTIIKCPVCGEELTSMTGICPACGHEINAAYVSESLQDFIDNLNQFDDVIAGEDSKPKKTGWSTWGIGGKVAWVIVNIILLCIPLIIYLFSRAIMWWIRCFMPNLTPTEKKKAQYIGNYVFTNDRETLLQALLFIKGKIIYLSESNDDTQNDDYWSKVWLTQAKSIRDKIKILYKDDEVAENTYDEIQECRSKIRRQGLIRWCVCIAVLVIVIIFIGTRCSASSSTVTSEDFDWPTYGNSQYIPVPSSLYGKIQSDSETRFSCYVDEITEEEFKEYINECKNQGFTLYVDEKEGSYKAYNDERYYLYIYYYSTRERMDISITAPMEMAEISWPNSVIASQIPTPDTDKLIGNIESESSSRLLVYIDDIDSDKFNDYIDECMDMGFTIDYSRDKAYFKAYNKDGYYLTLEEQDFDIMCIEIKEPQQED